MTPSEQAVLTTTDKNEKIIKTKVDALIKELVPAPQKSLDEASAYAQACHERLLAATRVGKAVNLVVRAEAVNLFLGEENRGFKGVRVPYPELPGEYLSFEEFGAYLNYVADAAGIGPSAVSGLYNFLVNIVEPISKGQIAAPETGAPYNVDDVMNLREKHLQLLASAANTLRYAEGKTDEEKREILGELIFVANDPAATQKDFEAAIFELGLKTRRNAPFTILMTQVGDMTAFQVVVPTANAAQITTALESRADIVSATFGELIDALNTISPKYTVMLSDDSDIPGGLGGNESEPSAEEYQRFLQRKGA